MPAIVTVGCQWGDEGKGKVISALAEETDWMVRHQGGNNAGHTVLFGGEKYVVHLLPTGVLFPHVRNVIASGVVVDPLVLCRELDTLRERGVDVTPQRLLLSGRANLIMPYHKLLDGLEEERRGGRSVGTTKRGIGPAYIDKVGRHGVKVFDLLDADRFRKRTAEALELKNPVLEKVYGHAALTVEEIAAAYLPCAERLRDYVGDDTAAINDALDDGSNVLFEGAQGTMLDVDFGTYPYLTSSNTMAGGACTGAGVSPARIDSVLGIIKAYTTRVGAGPMPTEADTATADKLRNAGPIGEFGATTGRPRRCGWLDAPLARFAVRANGIDALALTRLDVLGYVDHISVCTAYELHGKVIALPPADMALLGDCKPVYRQYPSWRGDISGARSYDDLPAEARAYVNTVEELLGAPVVMISVGPERDQTILRRPSLFAAAAAV